MAPHKDKANVLVQRWRLGTKEVTKSSDNEEALFG